MSASQNTAAPRPSDNRRVARRLVGVEEELLLVDPGTGRSVGRAERAVRAGNGPEVEEEIYRQQIETANAPAEAAADVRAAIVAGRRAAGEAARAVGAAAVAVATPVLDGPAGDVAPKERYEQIVEAFGDVARGVVVCGMHTHVDVADEDEAVAVMDRARPWLPVLLALSSNSPFFAGRATGYESWRSQVWGRWPTAGPTEPFGDAAGYHAAVAALVETGAARDRGMMYLDVRPAEAYPTVEIRVADVCTDIDDAVLVAVLARGLVETASRQAQDGVPVPGWRTDLLTAATWRASRDGLSGQLVHPVTKRLASARAVLDSLLDHVGDALRDSGDLEDAVLLVDGLLRRGTGAARQRSVHEATGDPAAVMADLLRRTEASWA